MKDIHPASFEEVDGDHQHDLSPDEIFVARVLDRLSIKPKWNSEKDLWLLDLDTTDSQPAAHELRVAVESI